MAANIRAKKILYYLLSVTFILTILNIFSIVFRLNRAGLRIQLDGSIIYKLLYILMEYFDLNHENSVPSLFSVLLLAFICVLLLHLKTSEKNRFLRANWTLLAIIFLFICFDEFLSIHELLIDPLGSLWNTSGFFLFAWVIPYGLAVLVLFLVFLKFLLKLPRKTAYMFIVSGFIYVFGALIFEMFEGWAVENYGYKNKWFWIFSSVQEVLEMIGLIFFIYALISYRSFELKIKHTDK